MIKAGKLAMPTGIENNISGAVIRVRLHRLQTGGTVFRDCQLPRIDRLRSIIGAVVGGSQFLDKLAQCLGGNDEPATIGAKTGLHVFVNQTHFKSQLAFGTLKFGRLSLWLNGFDGTTNFFRKSQCLRYSTTP